MAVASHLIVSVKLPIGSGFCYLQIKADAFAVNQHAAGVNELLASTIVTPVAAQRGKRKEEFHGFGGVSRGSFAWQMYSRAQADPVEFRFFFKISQHRSNQVSDMLIEGEGRQLVARSAGRRR